jgi:membrane associated rhomboid family serine protease
VAFHRVVQTEDAKSVVGLDVCFYKLELISVMFVLLVIVNVLVFLHESNLGSAALRQFVWKYAFIPSKLGITDSSMMLRAPADLFQKISPMVTSQFLHAGSMHLLSNMVVLLFLGKKVEERIGSLKFLAFYLASGIAGNIVYAAFHLDWPKACDGFHPVNIPTRPSPNTMRIFLKSVAMRSCE